MLIEPHSGDEAGRHAEIDIESLWVPEKDAFQPAEEVDKNQEGGQVNQPEILDSGFARHKRAGKGDFPKTQEKSFS